MEEAVRIIVEAQFDSLRARFKARSAWWKAKAAREDSEFNKAILEAQAAEAAWCMAQLGAAE